MFAQALVVRAQSTYISRRKRLEVTRELLRIRRALNKSNVDVVFLYNRFNELMRSIRGRTPMEWLEVSELSECVACQELRELQALEDVALEALNKTLRDRSLFYRRDSYFPSPNNEWNIFIFIRLKKRRLQEFYEEISAFNKRVRECPI